jgi:hypothetical protein
MAQEYVLVFSCSYYRFASLIRQGPNRADLVPARS